VVFFENEEPALGGLGKEFRGKKNLEEKQKGMPRPRQWRLGIGTLKKRGERGSGGKNKK